MSPLDTELREGNFSRPVEAVKQATVALSAHASKGLDAVASGQAAQAAVDWVRSVFVH